MEEKAPSPEVVQIVHNPTAGNGQHKKEQICEPLEQDFKQVFYVSTHHWDWEGFRQNSPDIIVLGGGDGTVHKLTEVLFKNKESNPHTPIYLLPLGTANNISKSLGIRRDLDAMNVDPERETIKFDIGKVTGLGEEKRFLEGVGLGIFPKLVSEMESCDLDPSEELQQSREALISLAKEYKAQKVWMEADGKTIEGSFLLVELLNIQFIGPNIELAPNADSGDSFFDLVLLSEENRNEFVKYLESLEPNQKNPLDISRFTQHVKVKNFKLQSFTGGFHIDDDLIPEASGKTIEIEVIPDGLRFFK